MTRRNSPRRRVQSQWYNVREAGKQMARDLRAMLPWGWTRHSAHAGLFEARLAAQVVQGTNKISIFHHDSLDHDDDRNSWIMPLPIIEMTANTLPWSPMQTPYLFCNTQRGYLWLGQAETRSCNFSLMNGNNQQVGYLRIHDYWSVPEQLERKDQASPRSDHLKVELVAICGQREHTREPSSGSLKDFEVWKDVPELAFEGEDPIMIAETYWVLWVEWVDGIAYRLASGQVNKQTWESLLLEEIELCLG